MIEDLVESIQQLSLEAIEKYLVKEDFEKADMALPTALQSGTIGYAIPSRDKSG